MEKKRLMGEEEKLKTDFGVYMRLGKLKQKRIHLENMTEETNSTQTLLSFKNLFHNMPHIGIQMDHPSASTKIAPFQIGPIGLYVKKIQLDVVDA